jgi:predicted dehydrogenase
MLKFAIVGLGRWGQRLVDSVQGTSDKIRFAAAVTRTPAKVASYAARQGLIVGDDYGAALRDPRIDAVVLATPHSQHAAQIEAAATAGKPVFVEKPFTLDQASAMTAVAACQRAKVPLGFGHNRRFLPAMREMRRRIASDALGTLLHIEGNFSSSGALRYQPELWRASAAESPAGGMTALGIHQIDAMIDLCGEVKNVHALSQRRAAAIDIDDTTAMMFTFANGMLGSMTCVFATPPIWRLLVMGTRGWVEMQGEDRLLCATLDGPMTELIYPATNMERVELEAFADTIATGVPYPVSAEQAIHGVAVLEATIASAKSGRTIQVA